MQGMPGGMMPEGGGRLPGGRISGGEGMPSGGGGR